MVKIDWSTLAKGDGNKKYKVKVDGRTVQFGDRRYQHYKDVTPLKLWSSLDHLDKKRRDRYRKRHGAQGFQNKVGSPAWFSWHYLW